MADAAPSATKARWFSANPDKARAEKFFLLYSPVWMALMALMMLTGWAKTAGNLALLGHGSLVAGPLLLSPLWLRDRAAPWHASYALKANLYILVFGFYGNYFGSEYFFDVLGMVYRFPNATTTLDSALVGSGKQQVPVIMYLYTHAYFMTYHTSAVVILRRIRTSALPLATLSFPLAIFGVGYFWAWLETKAMANPTLAGAFYYEKMDAMLSYGSIIYSTYFLASFPFFYLIDEGERRWSAKYTLLVALAVSMLGFYLLDFCAAAVGKL